MKHRIQDYTMNDLRFALESTNFSPGHMVKLEAEMASRLNSNQGEGHVTTTMDTAIECKTVDSVRSLSIHRHYRVRREAL